MKKLWKLLIPTLLLAVAPALQPAVHADCNPFCVTSLCHSNGDCTAAPHGRCNFACPGTGCCVYP